MHIVPVIDVRGGIAVAAAGGDRARYRPLQSPLAAGCGPVAVAQGYLALYPFTVLYAADLDGIEGRGADPALPVQIAAALPGVEVWLDCGAWWRGALSAVPAGEGSRASRAGTPAAPPEGATPVIGSESLGSIQEYEALRCRLGGAFVLSLDFKGGIFQGPPELLAQPGLWPQRLAVMALGRVGSRAGPDLVCVQDIAARAGGRHVYAAGGVRGFADLAALHRAGVHGALVATALHAGTLTAGGIRDAASLS